MARLFGINQGGGFFLTTCRDNFAGYGRTGKNTVYWQYLSGMPFDGLTEEAVVLCGKV